MMEEEETSLEGRRTVSTLQTGRLTGIPSHVTRTEVNNDPCWFLQDVSLRTGTIIVALIGIFSHPAFMFIALDYWLMGDTELMRTGAMAVFCANLVLTPVNYILLTAALLENRWLCIAWISITIGVAIGDIAIVIVFYNKLYFVIFQFILFFLTLYKLWVVVTFCVSLFKKVKAAKNVKKVASGGTRTRAQSASTFDESRIVVIESSAQI